MHFAELMMPDL